MAAYFKKTALTSIMFSSVLLTGTAIATTINFDDLTTGNQINLADPNWSISKVNGTTMIADISDKMAKSAPNSLYLLDDSDSDKPYAILSLGDEPAASGSVSFDAYIPSTNPKTVYVNFGTGKNNSQRYFELRLNAADGIIQYENGSDDQTVATFTADQWHTFNATWADGNFSVSVDGAASPEATNVSVESTGLSTGNIPKKITFYAGDKSSSGTSAYIDNIEINL